MQEEMQTTFNEISLNSSHEKMAVNGTNKETDYLKKVSVMHSPSRILILQFAQNKSNKATKQV